MTRLCLTIVATLALTGCVAKKDPAQRVAVDSPKPTNRPNIQVPLPLFHPDYKTGQPFHEYSESTEANLNLFSQKMKTIAAVEVRLWDPGQLRFRLKLEGDSEEPETEVDPLADLPPSENWVIIRGAVYWRVLSDNPETIAKLRWAFSGNLRETRVPGTTLYFTFWTFYLADGSRVDFGDGGSYLAASAGWLTWGCLGFTPEMRWAIEPVFQDAREKRSKLWEDWRNRR